MRQRESERERGTEDCWGRGRRGFEAAEGSRARYMHKEAAEI